MEIRKKTSFIEKYAGAHHQINEKSPELLFMKYVCDGDLVKAISLFKEKKMFTDDLSAIDAPFGRYEGLNGIKEFAGKFLSVFHAESAQVQPVIQTRANGHAITELVINFVINQEIEQIPMFVVSDLRTQNTLDEVRIYFHCSYLPEYQPYRKPIFKSAHLEMGDPGILTGAVREYYEALHHTPNADVERIVNVKSPNCILGGYNPAEDEPGMHITFKEAFTHMSTYIPRCVGMRYETITDDGKNCILEWVHIVSKAGVEELNRVALSGIAAYERGEDGRLCSIRICDYAGWENNIDWSKTGISKAEAMAINFVEEFPSGVGMKSQT